MGKWIKLEDGLPESGEIVAWRNDKGYIVTGKILLFNKDNKFVEMSPLSDSTHWFRFPPVEE
jgi:hypothetical protein